ncbi:MAG: YfcE family phosphodiesterase [Spirochaetes bacterium]|nr:YfcE family phosphodiesterase [Spirochaetota bacterium]
MYKLLVISDTHNDIEAVERIVGREQDIHGILHLGDTVEDLHAASIPSGIDIHCVHGNCDASTGEKKITLTVHDVRVYATHGDLYGVKSSLDLLHSHVKEHDAAIGFFGHTHAPVCKKKDGVELYNPGTVTKGEYIIATFENGSYVIEFKELGCGA